MIVSSNSENARPTEAAERRVLSAAGGLLPAQSLKASDGAPRNGRMLEPANVDALLSAWNVPPSFWVSTDDNLIIEYSTPKGAVLDSQKSTESNLNSLFRHFGEESAVAALSGP